MAQFVLINEGRYSTGRDSFREIRGVTFPLVDGTLTPSDRGEFLLVDGVPVRGYPKRSFKVFTKAGAYEMVDSMAVASMGAVIPRDVMPETTETNEIVIAAPVSLRGEDDDVIKARIKERFDIVSTLVTGAIEGKVRGIVVSGVPGVGKSHEVKETLEHGYRTQVEIANIMVGDEKGDNGEPLAEPVPERPRYRFITGHVAPMALYNLLYDYRDEKSVLVLDDSDTVLHNETSINLLKSAMNNKGKRIIDWGSRAVEGAGLPDSFEFNGAVVFITNVNFDHPKFKNTAIGEHLRALISRVYYVDIGIKNARDCFLRIEQVCNDSDILANLGLEADSAKEVLDFFEKNVHKFRELSIRTVEKIAGTRILSPYAWERISTISTFRPEHL